MTLKEWQTKGIQYLYKNYKIFTIDEGEGEDLLLIHGFPTSSWDWWQMHQELTKKYRVLCLDMIGFGFSAKPRKYNYSIFDQADLIEDFLQSKHIKTVKILSHDYGDTVAQELLARFNQRELENKPGLNIESLCFLNGGLFVDSYKPLFIQKLLMSPLGGLVGRFFTREKLGKNFKMIFGPHTQPSELELDEFWELINFNGGKYVVHLVIRYMKERVINQNRWLAATQHTNVPLRLIDGLADPISGQNMVKMYKKIIPNPDVVDLEEIGHFPLIEAPEQVLEHYLAFIENLNNESAPKSHETTK